MPGAHPTLRVAVTLEQCWHRVPGGTARAALEIVDALVARGEVDVHGAPRRLELVGVSARHRNPAPAPWTPTIPVAALGLPRRALYETWHVLGRPRVERATGPVDVIHVTGLAMPPRTVPIVVTLHDLAFRRDPGQFTRNGRHFFDAAWRHIVRDADLGLCSSEATRLDAQAAGIEPVRLRVVPLGVRPVAVPDGAVEALRDRVALPGRYVLHLGTAEPRKNRAALLRASRALPDDVAIVLAGATGWGHGVDPASAGSRRVVDLGFVSEPDKHALLAGASAFCFPSTWEGFGLPVLEAMAHGTPVVTSAGTSLAEVAGDAALLVDPHDDRALADALRAVLDDEAVAGALRQAGPERAAGFGWDRTAAATAAAYAEVADR
jgi:glycosyltransferase involved in cell wall biosynthesis